MVLQDGAAAPPLPNFLETIVDALALSAAASMARSRGDVAHQALCDALLRAHLDIVERRIAGWLRALSTSRALPGVAGVSRLDAFFSDIGPAVAALRARDAIARAAGLDPATVTATAVPAPDGCYLVTAFIQRGPYLQEYRAQTDRGGRVRSFASQPIQRR